MGVALFYGSMVRRRGAATSAPAKFGIRPCGGNGKRATPSALSLSQTHCRAALLLAKPRAMTESGPVRPGDSQGRNLPHEEPPGSPAVADFLPVDRDRMFDAQAEPPPERNPSRVGGSDASKGDRRFESGFLQR